MSSEMKWVDDSHIACVCEIYNRNQQSASKLHGWTPQCHVKQSSWSARLQPSAPWRATHHHPPSSKGPQCVSAGVWLGPAVSMGGHGHRINERERQSSSRGQVLRAATPMHCLSKIRTCQMQAILIHFDNPSWSLNPWIPYWLKESKESQSFLLSLVAANPSCLLGGKSCFCQQVIWRIPSTNLPGDAASLQWQCMAMPRGYMLHVSTCYTFLLLLTFFWLFFSSSVI